MTDHKLNIVVIDDDKEDAEILSRKLTLVFGLNFELRHIGDPKVSLLDVVRETTDLIFIDYNLGCRTGLDVLKAVRSTGCRLPIIMLTGQGNEAVATECMRSGADDYVSKVELSTDTLRRTIEYAQSQYARRDAETEIGQLARFPSESPDPIMRVDRRGVLLYANEASEVLLRSWGIVRGDSMPTDLCAVINDLMCTGDRRTLPVTGDGRHYDLVFVGITNEQYVNLYGRDITERKMAEESLREKETLLRRKQRLEVIGSLAGGVAHEFNNLLQVICGYTKFAMEELPVESGTYQDLEKSIDAADRATLITRQLLSFSCQQVNDRNCHDLAELLRGHLELLRPLLDERIELKLIVDDGVTALVDREMLEQSIMNLCLNAADAMPNGGELKIQLHPFTIGDRREQGQDTPADLKPGSYARLTVTDTGVGIPPEIQNQIFDPFFTTKDVGKGTGMGLPFAYGVVQQHEGAISVQSKPGEGTTFIILLPSLEETDMQVDPPPAQAAPEIKESILIAEDESLVRELTARTLRRAGYEVLTAENGEEAVEVFRENAKQIGLLVSDVIMPKLSGHDAYLQMKEICPNLKAIFCSGYDPETANTKEFIEQGLQVMQKPYDSNDLLKVVRDVLDTEDLSTLVAAP